MGVSFDEPAENAAFREKFDFPFPLLSDRDRSLAVTVGAADTPDAGYARRISYLVGPEGKIVHTYPEVNPAEHAAEVLSDLVTPAP